MEYFNNVMSWNWSNIIVAASTTVLAILTWLLWRETAKTRHNNQSAEIVVNFEEHPRYNNAVNLVVENVGLGLARNLKLEIPDNIKIKLLQGEEVNFEKLSMFKEVIPIFKSRQKLKHFAFMYHQLDFSEKIEFSVKATWENYKNEKITLNSVVTSSFFRGLTTLGQDALHEIANAQKEISKNFNKVISRNMLNVETITQSERREQDQKFLEEAKKSKADN